MTLIKYLLFSIILLQLNITSANAYTRADFIFAAPVVKYEDGYLVSICPFEGPINQGGYLNKYLKRVLTGPGSFTPNYLLVDEADNKQVELNIKFKLGSNISLFGNALYRTKAARGVKFYLGYDYCGDKKYEISDVFVYIRGTPSIDSMKPVWAKNYQSKDMLYQADDFYPINNARGDCTEYLRNAHLEVVKAVGGFNNDSSRCAGSNITEYTEYCYSAGLDSNLTYNAVLVFNGKSSITNRLFCGSALLDSVGRVSEWIYSVDTLTTYPECQRCEASLIGMYHMDKYRNGILLFRTIRYYSTNYFLVFCGQDGMDILPFNVHQTYD